MFIVEITQECPDCMQEMNIEIKCSQGNVFKLDYLYGEEFKCECGRTLMISDIIFD